MILYSYDYFLLRLGNIDKIHIPENIHHTNVFNVNIEETFEECTMTFDCITKDYLKVGSIVEFIPNKERLKQYTSNFPSQGTKGSEIQKNLFTSVRNLTCRHQFSVFTNFNILEYAKKFVKYLSGKRNTDMVTDNNMVNKYRLMIDEITYTDNGLMHCKCSTPKFPYNMVVEKDGISTISQLQNEIKALTDDGKTINTNYIVKQHYLQNLEIKPAVSTVSRKVIFCRYGTTDLNILYTGYDTKIDELYRKTITDLSGTNFSGKTYLEATKEILNNNDFEIRISPLDMVIAYPKFENNQLKLKEIAEEKGIKLSDYIECERELLGYEQADLVVMFDKNGNNVCCTGLNILSTQYLKYEQAKNIGFQNIKLFKLDGVYDEATLQLLAKSKFQEIIEPKYTYKVKVKGFFSVGDIIKINPNKNINPNKIQDNNSLYLVVRKVVFNPDDPTVTYIECGQEKPNYFDELEKRTKETIRNTPTNINQADFDSKINSSSAVNGKINASVREQVGNIIGNTAEFTEIRAKVAALEELTSKKATILDLDAVKISTHRIDSDIANIHKLLAGEIDTISGKNIVLSSKNATIDDALIVNAVMKNASIRELAAGSINTSYITIKSTDNSLMIKDGTILINDNKGTSRLQIGKDKQGNYSIIINNDKGENIFNSNGITDKAIPTPIIRDDMIIPNANINASKININSVVDELNKSGTKTLKASKIVFDEDGQTLTAKLSKISETKTTKDIYDSTTKLSLDEVLQKLSLKSEKTISDVSEQKQAINKISSDISGIDKKAQDNKTSLDNLKSETDKKLVEYKQTTEQLNLSYKNLEKTVNQISLKTSNVFEILRPFNFMIDSKDKLDVLRSDGEYYERPWIVNKNNDDPLSIASGLNNVNVNITSQSEIREEKRTRYNSARFKEFTTYYNSHKNEDLTPGKWTDKGLNITDHNMYYANEIYYKQKKEWANTNIKPKQYVLRIVASSPIAATVWTTSGGKFSYTPSTSEIAKQKQVGNNFVYTKLIDTTTTTEYEDIAVYVSKYGDGECYINYIGAYALFDEMDYVNTEINTAKESIKTIQDTVNNTTTKITQNVNEIQMLVEKMGDNLVVPKHRGRMYGNDIMLELSKPMLKGNKYSLIISNMYITDSKNPYVYNSNEKKGLNDTRATVFTANGDKTDKLNIFPCGTNGWIEGVKLYEGDFGGYTKSLINLSNNSIKIKAEAIEIDGETIIRNVNGTGGTKINGDRVDVRKLYGTEIYGGKFFAGNNSGKPYMEGSGDVLQINIPDKPGASYGVVCQFAPSITYKNAYEYRPKGLFIGNDPNFNTGDTLLPTDDYLITNTGLTSSGFRYKGGVREGAVVCTNYGADNPISTQYKGTTNYRISFISLYSDSNNGAVYLFIHDGTSGKSDFYVKVNESQSDKRLKENIIDCEYKALEIIQKFRFKSFDWKPDDKGNRKQHTNIGLIAQEVEEVAPELVSEVGGNKNLDDFRMLHYALKGIQEMAEQNKAIEAENKRLAEQNKAIEAENIKLRAEMLNIKNVVNDLVIKVSEIKKEKEN